MDWFCVIGFYLATLISFFTVSMVAKKRSVFSIIFGFSISAWMFIALIKMYPSI